MNNELTFKLTEDHVKLLQRMVITWGDVEYGAPTIDGKRPYGDSAVEADIIGILGWFDTDNMSEKDWDDYYDVRGVWQEYRQRARKIHKETETALQIVLTCKTFEPGTFVRSKKWKNDWKRVE